MSENKLIVVIRDERTKANNKLSAVIGLSAIAFLMGAAMIRTAVEAAMIKVNKAVKEVTEETESEGE